MAINFDQILAHCGTPEQVIDLLEQRYGDGLTECSNRESTDLAAHLLETKKECVEDGIREMAQDTTHRLLTNIGQRNIAGAFRELQQFHQNIAQAAELREIYDSESTQYDLCMNTSLTFGPDEYGSIFHGLEHLLPDAD